MNTFKQLDKYTRAMVVTPLLICVLSLGYTHVVTGKIESQLSEIKMDTLNVSVENNRLISQENSDKIDALHSQIVDETLKQFRTEDMQAWIQNFREENPDLHIPDLILTSQ